ncbi:hypothetical protein [Paeniglutamicibacter sp.]|uniref:hypothetical protein n=1 Tax=Paeniglutamicibacter sp. TaxID=1934391 RepID=UPI003989C06D
MSAWKTPHEQSYLQTLVIELYNVIAPPGSRPQVPDGCGKSEEQIRAQAAAYDAAAGQQFRTWRTPAPAFPGADDEARRPRGASTASAGLC